MISFTGLVLLVYGIIHASVTLTFLTPSVWIPILLGVLVLTGFVIAEARSDHRSFDVTLFKNRGYAVSLTAVSLAFFAMSGILFTLPFFFQTLRGFSTLEAGLCFLPFAVGQIIAAPRSAGMVARFGYRKVMTAWARSGDPVHAGHREPGRSTCRCGSCSSSSSSSASAWAT